MPNIIERALPSRPKYQTLMAGQKLTHTDNGQDINRSIAPLMTASGIDLIRNEPTISDEKRLVLLPPFSNMDRVTNHLYLTSLGGLTLENFMHYQISCVINATHDLPILSHKSIETYRIPVDDDIVEDILMYFDDVADKIEETAKNGGKTVVHCMAGVSRSTTLVLAYLIKYHNFTIRDAFLTVRSIRPCVRPNIAFVGQLIAYEEKLKGSCHSSIIKFVHQNRLIRIPDFYENDCPDLYLVEIAKQTQPNVSLSSTSMTSNSSLK